MKYVFIFLSRLLALGMLWGVTFWLYHRNLERGAGLVGLVTGIGTIVWFFFPLAE
jgi:hypothetical protein